MTYKPPAQEYKPTVTTFNVALQIKRPTDHLPQEYKPLATTFNVVLQIEEPTNHLWLRNKLKY
jgi:hypothetical protein